MFQIKFYTIMILATAHCYNLQPTTTPAEALPTAGSTALLHEQLDSLGQSAGTHGTVVALGNFDGVHAGHQAILGTTYGWAMRLNALPMVFSFKNHPKEVLRPNDPPVLLCDFNERLLRLQQESMAWACCPVFDAHWADLTPEAFVETVLRQQLAARAVVVGYDFCFGKARQGSARWLQEHASRLGIEVMVLPPVRLPRPTSFEHTLENALEITKEEAIVGSSGIRNLLTQSGDVVTAHQWLTRAYAIHGVVEQGFQRGRQVGFPTANLRPLIPSLALPKHGAYSAWIVEAAWQSVPRLAMVNIGFSPTYAGGTPQQRVEAHVLDASSEWNCYGKPLSVVFIERLREEQAFESVEALVAQLHEDQAQVQQRSAFYPPVAEAEQRLLQRCLRVAFSSTIVEV
jgi:riboflavin kinase/FMN adenylyltransferase